MAPSEALVRFGGMVSVMDTMAGEPHPIEARRLLAEAARRHPGAWIAHSERVGEAARRIAEIHPDLQADTAESLGLLHDIGRREGPTGKRHILDGYQYLIRLGYPNAARICITHSFPVPDFSALTGRDDLTPDEGRFVKSFIEACEFDEYDRLIMLCDCLATARGFCLIEKRIVDVVLRHGADAARPDVWRAALELRDRFSEAVGRSVYSILPNIEETTFSLDAIPDV